MALSQREIALQALVDSRKQNGKFEEGEEEYVEPDIELEDLPQEEDLSDEGLNTKYSLEETTLDSTEESEIEDIKSDTKLHKIKVNGVEQEVTYEELIRRAQLVESADAYQHQAKLAYEQALQKLEQLSQERDAEFQANEEAELAEVATAIQMGSTEEATNALRKLLKRNEKPHLSADDVSLAVEQKLTFQKAVEEFKQEYPDIFEDQVLLDMVMQRDNACVQAKDTRNYMERYRSIGDEVREWRNNLIKKETGSVSKAKDMSLRAKEQRKSVAPQTYPGRKATSQSNQTENYEDGELTPAERQAELAKMAKARNLVYFPKTNY
jgi:hypothetical protein